MEGLKTQYTPKRTKVFNPLSANPTKWLNTLKQFVGKLPSNCFSVFDHFLELGLKGLTKRSIWITETAVLMSTENYNPGQSIWNRIEKSSKAGQVKKSLISTFAYFWAGIAKA